MVGNKAHTCFIRAYGNSFSSFRVSLISQIEEWARMPEELGPRGRLAFLGPESRKAVSQVGHCIRIIECKKAVRKLQTDKEFQEDVASSHVQGAVLEVTQNAASIEKYGFTLISIYSESPYW